MCLSADGCGNNFWNFLNFLNLSLLTKPESSNTPPHETTPKYCIVFIETYIEERRPDLSQHIHATGRFYTKQSISFSFNNKPIWNATNISL